MKRILAIITAAAMLVSFAVIVNGAEEPATAAAIITGETPAYIARNGVIKEVNDFYDADGEAVEGRKLALVTGQGQGTFVFLITEDTFFFEGEFGDIKAGANITGFFDSSLPMMMIYPPQYRIAYLAVGYAEPAYFTADRFDKDFINSEDTIKLNLTNENAASGATEIIFEDGTEFKGDVAELAGRKLIVCYDIITRSIPGITTPKKIVILYETAVHPILTLTPEEIREFMMVYDNAVIQVNGETIAHRAYLSDSNHVMVPVRAVAEAMGFEVIWFGDTQSVQVGRSLSFAIGTDAYAFARMAPVSLGQAPVLRRLDSRNSLTYVPIDFFVRQELGATAAGYMAEFDEEFDAQVINIIFDVTE